MMDEHMISDEIKLQYEADGVIVLRNVISKQWLKKLEEAVEREIANPGPFFHGYDTQVGKGKFHGNLRVWENDEDFKRYCFDSVLPKIAQQLFASKKVNLLYDQLFVKEPNTLNRTRWHNDQPYWPITGDQIVSFWLCLDPVDQKNGALEFVKGSQKWNSWYQPESFGEGSGSQYTINENFETIPDIESNREAYDIVSWDLEPGDLYVFHGLTLHGANANSSSTRRRRGYTVRYTGDDIRYDIRKGLSAPICNEEMSQGEKLSGEQYPVVYSLE